MWRRLCGDGRIRKLALSEVEGSSEGEAERRCATGPEATSSQPDHRPVVLSSP